MSRRRAEKDQMPRRPARQRDSTPALRGRRFDPAAESSASRRMECTVQGLSRIRLQRAAIRVADPLGVEQSARLDRRQRDLVGGPHFALVQDQSRRQP